MDFDEKRRHYRSDFPILDKITWLDHAGHGPWSLSTIRIMEEFSRTFSHGPVLPYDDWDAVMHQTREMLARLLNAKVSEIGFNFTTSLTISMLTHAIRWEPGDNVIVPDRTFPAIVMSAKLLGQDGVEARIVEPVDRLISEEKLIGAIDERTKMMIVPQVNFLTGQRLDVARISKACRDAEVFLVVDAIQAVGPTKVDVKALGCHSLCFGSLKWMLSPMGVGTVYIDQREIEKLKIPQIGMSSVEDPWNFFDYDQTIIPDCKRFECGCASHLAHHGMKPVLEMFLDLGLENIETYILGLTGELHDRLTAKGADVLTPREDSRRAGIITFDAESLGWDDADTLGKTCLDAGIRVAVRMGLIRISPHFYTEKEDIDRFLKVVNQCCPK